MARVFARREKNVIILGGIFLVCFLAVWSVVRPAKGKLDDLKEKVSRMTKEYEEIHKIEAQYNFLKRETDPVMQRILQRRKDFDLSAFVAETDTRLNFTRTRAIPITRPGLYGNFEKRTSTFFYDDKSLRQIVDFVKELEKPEHVVAVEMLRIWPKSPTERSKLNLEIKLSTVVPVKGKS